MKKTIKLLYYAFIAFILSTYLHATSGTLSIGPVNGAHTGVGSYKSVDTMVLNPSWIGEFTNQEKDRVLSIGMFRFVPTFESKINIISDTTFVKNDMGTIQLPHIGYITTLQNDITYGFGLFTGGGSGSNFTDAPTAYDAFFANTNAFFTTTSLVNSISYKKNKFRIGLTADYTTGALSQSVDDSSNTVGSSSTAIKLDTFSSTNSFRYLIGFGYKYNDLIQWGINYTSKLTLDFEDGNVAYTNDEFVYTNRTIEEPSRLSTGINVAKNKWNIISDLHYIYWEDTNYIDYGWENGTMWNTALRYTLLPQKWYLSVGYSQSSRVIKNTQASSIANLLINTAFQPAILEKEISLSTHYIVSDTFSFTANTVYWPQTEVKQTFSIYEGTLKSSGYAFALSMNMGF